jgi:small subunit ribosomal protein S10
MPTKTTTTKPATKAAKPAVKTAAKVVAPAVKAPKAAAKPKTDEFQKLRIRVRAYEHKILDASVKQIIDTAVRYDAKVLGPVPLPAEIKKYTVNRSTFVHKDAREQFEIRTHKRLIDIINPNQKVIEALTNLSLPSGVSIDVKMG